MNPKFFWLITAILLVPIHLVEAQQPKIYKIGELTARPGLRRPSEEFLGALREIGYIEGKNIAFEVQSAEGKPDRFPALAAELVGHKVDVLVASSTAEARAFKNATNTIPIVFYTGGDPIEVGLVDSLARPGGNVTGVTLVSAELIGKRLELLKETIPALSRVAVMWVSISQWKESQVAARELGLQLHSMEVSSAGKYERAFQEAIQARSAALVVTDHALALSNRKQIADLATKNRLPAIYGQEVHVESGGLMSYGADEAEISRRVASMVNKILNGTKPAEIPVEQPTKFELVINLQAAKQIGLTIPPNVLARADRVIR